MQKKNGLLIVGMVAVTVVSVMSARTVVAEGKEGALLSAGALPNCPVMGEPINFAISAPTAEGPVYFCCGVCIKKYKADPGKYASLVADQRKMLADRAKIQVKCPVTSEPVDPKVSVEYAGQKVSFCCKGCVKKFQADPSKYQTGLASSYTYQTKCPVTDEDITPTAYANLPTGETIYYCCKECDKKFIGNPGKYAAKLEAQGVSLNVAKLVKMLEKGAGGHEGHGDGHGHDHDHD